MIEVWAPCAERVRLRRPGRDDVDLERAGAARGGWWVAGVELHHFYLALITLGMGWNFSYVGATSLLGTTHTRAEQAKVQGLNDFLVLGLVAVGSFGSGALLNTYGWTAVQYAMAPALLLALAGIAWLALVARSTE